MFASPPFTIPTVLGMVAVCSLSYAAEKQVIFKDGFNRANADAVGQGWTSKGEVELKDKAVLFNVMEEEFRPRIKHTFPLQKKGRFTVSFLMDWLRQAEGTWSFYMQLGNSAKIPRVLIYERDLAKGIGVNLVWGGGTPVANQAAGTLGYYSKGKFHGLFVLNNQKVAKTVVKEAVITIEVVMDAGTYTIKCNGKTYPKIPFDNKGPIDTIRFIANGCSNTGFTKSSIDEVTISKEDNE
ncbi:MAG: hypothetical protein VCA55_10915 [Verrucomicrobiales bacterium]